jgi:hypothetical protein
MTRAAELCGEPAPEIAAMMVDGHEFREQHGYFVESLR